MSFDPAEELRQAGILNSPLAAEVEEAFATLTREEVDLLVSLKDKLPNALPGVLAGVSAGVSADGEWSEPEVVAHSVPVAADCLCGAWSGSGSGAAN
ncbi:StsA-related sactipeptide RiPP [Herbidospora mongoliensis]|uniref:StsA-related sactipeptide RiPP n=1 Tax=Herbidospora mongoliensis TaxID=688067 RepID=UPI000834B8C0|nr:StsA-related sactipeptide RiPP [Herbidospora mongoliensis]